MVIGTYFAGSQGRSLYKLWLIESVGVGQESSVVPSGPARYAAAAPMLRAAPAISSGGRMRPGFCVKELRREVETIHPDYRVHLDAAMKSFRSTAPSVPSENRTRSR